MGTLCTVILTRLYGVCINQLSFLFMTLTCCLVKLYDTTLMDVLIGTGQMTPNVQAKPTNAMVM